MQLKGEKKWEKVATTTSRCDLILYNARFESGRKKEMHDPTFPYRGQGAVGDGEGKGASVVRDDAVSGVLEAHVIVAELSSVGGHAGDQLLDGVNERLEHVGVVVGLLVLQHRHQTLKAHPCIHVLGR